MIKNSKTSVTPPHPPQLMMKVREWLADKQPFQAQFAVPDLPGRNQLVSRQNEIIGADLIEFEKTSKMAPASCDPR